MTEEELLIDLHRHSKRQGPGSEKETLKALDCLNLPTDRQVKIADMGCGSGSQTIVLAQNTSGQITAIDLFDPFLDELNQKALSLGLTHRIETLKTSMDDLPFHREELDLIWAEGSIYILGFANGIKLWKNFLKPGGYIAVSEITWITNTRPKAIEQFWVGEYPEIDTASNKIKVLEDHNFTLEGYFNLRPQSWMDEYYQPLEEKFEVFLERHHHSELARKIVDDHMAEIDWYRKYREYYSYGFYMARKN